MFVSRKVKYPACGNLTIFFAIFDPGGAVNAIFRVDEVESSCAEVAFPNVQELPLDLVPPDGKCAEDPQCAAFQTVEDRISSPRDRQPVSVVPLVIAVVVILIAAVLLIFRRRRPT